ncbi:DUF2267 domain-containing protein [Maritimibacter sp. DP1N21-5]|uniref:DUF2267 domain-containing protein n=1 Tax=Maritimibacter sp. DP1N21-5 TaxID=2836867 RepID=UPI002106DAC8|nr:DUF2267 domain-containing protein [Maritimibacter sp. DP1N21-5]
MPWSYRHATKDWQAFLSDAKEEFAFASDNSTYTAVQGVLWTFRDRLSPEEVAAFCQPLPAVLRALFLQGWTAAPAKPWTDRAALEEEARLVRVDHNLTPPAPISLVARALRRHVRQVDFDRVLERIGPEARAFWHVENAYELERRIV